MMYLNNLSARLPADSFTKTIMNQRNCLMCEPTAKFHKFAVISQMLRLARGFICAEKKAAITLVENQSNYCLLERILWSVVEQGI